MSPRHLTLPPCGGDVGTADRGGRLAVLVASCASKESSAAHRDHDSPSKRLGPPLSLRDISPARGENAGAGWCSHSLPFSVTFSPRGGRAAAGTIRHAPR